MAVLLNRMKFLAPAILVFAVALLGAPATHAATITRTPNNLGLVGYWSFNEGFGSQAGDSSGNGKTGTLVNSPAWVTGKYGQALNFIYDNNTSVSIPPTFVPNTSTVSFWINIDPAGMAGYGAVLTQDGFNGFWILEDHVVWYSGHNEPNNTALTRGVWHHVVVVNVAGAITFYLDGVVDGTAIGGFFYTAVSIGNDTDNRVGPGNLHRTISGVSA
jgi:hypothetical protein